MKRSASASLTALAVLAAGSPAPAQVAGTVSVGVTVAEMKEVMLGWSAKKQFLGKPLYNDKGEKVGSIDDVIIGSDKTSVSYVIVGRGWIRRPRQARRRHPRRPDQARRWQVRPPRRDQGGHQGLAEVRVRQGGRRQVASPSRRQGSEVTSAGRTSEPCPVRRVVATRRPAHANAAAVRRMISERPRWSSPRTCPALRPRCRAIAWTSEPPSQSCTQRRTRSFSRWSTASRMTRRLSASSTSSSGPRVPVASIIVSSRESPMPRACPPPPAASAASESRRSSDCAPRARDSAALPHGLPPRPRGRRRAIPGAPRRAAPSPVGDPPRAPLRRRRGEEASEAGPLLFERGDQDVLPRSLDALPRDCLPWGALRRAFH